MTGIAHHPFGPRLYVAGIRVHHGSAGLGLAVAAFVARRPVIGIVGLLAVAHDRADFPWRDCDNHAP